MLPTKCNYSFDESSSITFTPRRFGRSNSEVGILPQFLIKRGYHPASHCQVSRVVESFSASGEVLDQGVDEHVAGTGVEGEDIGGLGVGGDDGDVGDAADIETDAAKFWMAIEHIVSEGDEGSALAAQGDVGRAKVGDGGDAGKVGDDGAVADLQCRGGFCAEKSCGTALMEDGLAVIADEVDLFWGDAEFLACGERGICIDLAKASVQLAEFCWREWFLFGYAQDFFADGGREILIGVVEEFDF